MPELFRSRINKAVPEAQPRSSTGLATASCLAPPGRHDLKEEAANGEHGGDSAARAYALHLIENSLARRDAQDPVGQASEAYKLIVQLVGERDLTEAGSRNDRGVTFRLNVPSMARCGRVTDFLSLPSLRVRKQLTAARFFVSRTLMPKRYQPRFHINIPEVLG